MNGCELKKCRFWDGEKCNDKNDWISAENGEHCCGLRSDAVLVEKEKRKPLSDGTLELTDEELSEFIYLFYPNTKTLKISASGCFILSNAERNIINNYKAILWLAERFELIKED